MKVAILTAPNGSIGEQMLTLRDGARRAGHAVVLGFHTCDLDVIATAFRAQRCGIRALLVADLGTFGSFVAPVVHQLWNLYRVGIRLVTLDGFDSERSGAIELLSRLAVIQGSVLQSPPLALCGARRSAARAAARRSTRRTATFLRAERPRRVRLGDRRAVS